MSDVKSEMADSLAQFREERTGKQVNWGRSSAQVSLKGQIVRPQSAAVKQGKYLRTEIDKNKSIAFFKQSRVESASHVVLIKGVPKAMPFYTTEKKTAAEKMKRLGVSMSLSQQQYCPVPVVSVGTSKKPLSSYNPNAMRSRMPQPELRMQYKNASQICIGDPNVRSMKCHKTMSGGTYGKHAKVGYNTNPQILSEMTMDHKKKCK